jgi:hypothetical protein
MGVAVKDDLQTPPELIGIVASHLGLQLDETTASASPSGSFGLIQKSNVDDNANRTRTSATIVKT